MTGVADDMTLSFPNAYGAGLHFSYTAHPKRLIKHITIDNLADLPAPTVTGTIWFEVEWTIDNSAGVELYLDGVRWARSNNTRVRTSNSIEFRDANGEALWYADAPHAMDSSPEPIKCPAEYEVERIGGTYFIRVRVPREWLLTAVYPVQIDPTFTDGYGGDVTTYKDTSLYSVSSDTGYGDEDAMWLSTGAVVGLIEFDLSSIDAGATCDSATLSFWNDSTKSTERTLGIYELLVANADWTEGAGEAPATANQSTWDYRHQTGSGAGTAWAGSAGANTADTDFNSTPIGTMVYAANDGTGTEDTSSLTTAAVEDWFGGTNSNYGLRLFGIATSYPDIRTSDHATAANRPKLVVVYTDASSGSASESASESASGSASLSPSASGSASESASASASPSAPPLTDGEVCWGHDTGVLEANVRDFSGNWTGTGSIEGAGDAEIIALNAGENMVSEVVYTDTIICEVLQNEYDPTGDDVTLEYRHGATEGACEVAGWNAYVVPFASDGYAQIRITSTL